MRPLLWIFLALTLVAGLVLDRAARGAVVAPPQDQISPRTYKVVAVTYDFLGQTLMITLADTKNPGVHKVGIPFASVAGIPPATILRQAERSAAGLGSGSLGQASNPLTQATVVP